MQRLTLIAATLIAAFVLDGCVYRAAISQGNLLKDEDLDQVEIGMTQSQVRFLLGTPMIDDPFHRNRWDYVYYLRLGRQPATFKRWVTIEFEDGIVTEIRKDQELSPNL
jgi:outer membrane protein assembly factor BamE